MCSIRVGLLASAVVLVDIFPKLSEVRVGSRLDVVDGVGVTQTAGVRAREGPVFALVLGAEFAPSFGFKP